MIETLIPTGITESVGPVESFDFRTIVDIGGLPYVFKGTVPLIRRGFHWKVYVPEMEDYMISREPSAFFVDRANEVGYVWFGCAAGYMRVDAYGNQPGLYLIDIWSHTPTLSKKSRYHNASGIGNFLLHNLLAVADRKGEPIYLRPVPPPEGKLNMEAAVAWYEKNGFQHLPPEEWRPSARMVRYPNPLQAQAS